MNSVTLDSTSTSSTSSSHCTTAGRKPVTNPGSLLLANPKGQELYLAWRGNREIKSGRLKYLISALAIDFGVTYTLMRRSLEERGWLCCYWETKTLALSPRKATE